MNNEIDINDVVTYIQYLKKEKEILLAQAQEHNAGKPAEILEKIIKKMLYHAMKIISQLKYRLLKLIL